MTMDSDTPLRLNLSIGEQNIELQNFLRNQLKELNL